MCGAGSGGSLSEADVMTSVAVASGVPELEIIPDQRSVNTFENIAFGTLLVSGLPVDRLVIVTDGWHMPRALMCCRALGIKAVPNPYRDRTLSAIPHICREVPALIKYLFWLPGRVRTFRTGGN